MSTPEPNDKTPDTEETVEKTETADVEETPAEEVEAETPAEEETVEKEPEEEADPIAVLEEERDGLRDQLLRLRAEFQNYRKRTARDNERIRARATESLMADLLPVMDHLELALSHADDDSGALAEGINMVLRQFVDTLGKHGLEPIASEGETFDPELHEALMQQPSEEVEEGKVLTEFQKGYHLGDAVLRHAKVIVSSGAPEPEPAEELEADAAPIEETTEDADESADES